MNESSLHICNNALCSQTLFVGMFVKYLPQKQGKFSNSPLFEMLLIVSDKQWFCFFFHPATITKKGVSSFGVDSYSVLWSLLNFVVAGNIVSLLSVLSYQLPQNVRQLLRQFMFVCLFIRHFDAETTEIALFRTRKIGYAQVRFYNCYFVKINCCRTASA